MHDSLEILTENAYEFVVKALEEKGGEVSMDINHFGELNLVCKWKNRRSWRIVTKQYDNFQRAQGWVSLYTAEKLMAQANMNFEQATLAFVYHDTTVEFFSVRSGRQITMGDRKINDSSQKD